MNHQDWEPVVIRSSKRLAAQQQVQASKPAYTADASQIRKIDQATEPQKTKTLSLEARQTISSMRSTLKITQVELNKRCSFPANTIRDIESGRIVPAQSQLSILNRVLRTTIKLT
jgi:ribosome-binding protein aMBF1 (putative translation factor)